MTSSRPLVLAAMFLLGCREAASVAAKSGAAPGGGGEGGEPPTYACANRIAYEGSWPFTVTFEYDAAGALTRYLETGADGSASMVLTRAYDAEGRRTKQIEDIHYLTPVHREITWEYDGKGRVVRMVYDGWGSDGVVIESRITYGDDERPVKAEQIEDGVLQDTTHFRYLRGEPFVMEVGHDTDGDGLDDQVVRYSFAGGRWLTRSEVLEGEILQSSETFTYADGVEGQLVQLDFDENGDGVSDGVGTWSWDGGLLVHEAGSTPGTAVVDYTYDPTGQVLQKTLRVDGPNPISFVTRFTWAGDGLAHVERRTGDTDAFIEGWTFTRGCPADRSLDVRIAPANGWAGELPRLEYDVDLQTWWGIPEAL
jgi:hypothetical protein